VRPVRIQTTTLWATSIEVKERLNLKEPLPRRYATLVTAMIVLWSAVLSLRAAPESAQLQAAGPNPQYEGKTIASVELPGVAEQDRDHLLQLIPQKAGTSLERERVRESIRALYATGRFADIQAEVAPSGDGVVLTFVTSANFFVGAVNVEGAPSRPTANQITNAAKLQLGELFTHDKLNRALENIRQLMQENGYYRAQVTAESTSNATTQQVDVLFHISAGSPAHVGEVKVTGASMLSSWQVQSMAHVTPGDRVTAARVSPKPMPWTSLFRLIPGPWF